MYIEFYYTTHGVEWKATRGAELAMAAWSQIYPNVKWKFIRDNPDRLQFVNPADYTLFLLTWRAAPEGLLYCRVKEEWNAHRI